MKLSRGQTVLLTGASGGLGTVLAHALADAGLDLMLLAYPGEGLDSLRSEVEGKGVRAACLSSDLRKPEEARQGAEETRRLFGTVDLLVNNAGIEFTAPFHELTEQQIEDVLRLNLEAAMRLTRIFLPGMLQRGSGHVVNMASLAGKAPPALQEAYAASKAGLVAFTSSLRATYRGSGVSASVICPGFVETGIYTRLKETSGCAAPALLGTSRPETVARAVLRAIERDLPDVVINPYPVRPLLALTALAPRIGEWATRQLGAHDFFRRAHSAQKQRERDSRNDPPVG